MPRAETRYYCNICGAFWGSEEKAIECEKSHLSPKKISNSRYVASENENIRKYPESVLVHFEDDGYVRYYRNR